MQVLKDERRAVSPTDTLSTLIGPLTENCRGRADKHHTAHHQSTGLQIEAHEQHSTMEGCVQNCRLYNVSISMVFEVPISAIDPCHSSVLTIHRAACIILPQGTRLPTLHSPGSYVAYGIEMHRGSDTENCHPLVRGLKRYRN